MADEILELIEEYNHLPGISQRTIKLLEQAQTEQVEFCAKHM